MLRNPCTHPHTPFWRVMPAMPVHSHYNSFQKLRRGTPCTFSHTPFRELYRQCLYALTTIPFGSYAKISVRFHAKIHLEVMPDKPVRFHIKSFPKLFRGTCTL